MCASRDIPPMTAFLYIPWTILVTDQNIRKRNPELNTLYERHPALFKRHYDAEYIRMIIFLWQERCKGEESFWKPYLDIINFTALPCLWTDNELALLQDVVLISNIKRYRTDFEEEWEQIYEVLHDNKYEHIIPGISDKTKKA